MAHTFKCQPLGGRGRRNSKGFDTNLIYRASSRVSQGYTEKTYLKNKAHSLQTLGTTDTGVQVNTGLPTRTHINQQPHRWQSKALYRAQLCQSFLQKSCCIPLTSVLERIPGQPGLHKTRLCHSFPRPWFEELNSKLPVVSKLTVKQNQRQGKTCPRLGNTLGFFRK